MKRLVFLVLISLTIEIRSNSAFKLQPINKNHTRFPWRNSETAVRAAPTTTPWASRYESSDSDSAGEAVMRRGDGDDDDVIYDLDTDLRIDWR